MKEIPRRLFWAFFALLPAVGASLFAQVPLPEAAFPPQDLFGDIARLTERLRAEASTPAALSAGSNGCGDSLDLAAIFDGCYGYTIRRMSLTPVALTLEAEMPLDRGVFSTSLRYRIEQCTSPRPQPIFLPTWEFTSDGIRYDGGAVVTFEGDAPVESCLRRRLADELDRRFHRYRSLHLPSCFQPHDSLPPTMVRLKIQGSSVETVQFAAVNSFLSSLRALAAGGALYAGPMAIAVGAQGFTITFYVIFRDAVHSDRQHLLTVAESFRYYAQDDHLFESSCEAELYPFIRTDNLLRQYEAAEAKRKHGLSIRRW